ncbi:MAG: ATP-binding cassette domain-containing protein [Treponema sp.]|nr:ATP-binding cassette domain-containing protein [Treponema sp.]
MNLESTFLTVNNLKKYFNVGRRGILKAVDDVSFSIEKGKIMGLVGESGCGKTTVGRTILKLYDADSGTVYLGGTNVLGSNKTEYKALTRRMQMIFQDPYASLNPRKIISDIVGEGFDIHKTYSNANERLERIYELLNMVGLTKEHANRFPHEFSGGQRQRIGIARALALHPEFVVCDEAISALDVSIQAQIINLLMRLQDELGLTYLFIAHDLAMVRHISDDIAVMYLGVIVEKGNAAEVYNNPIHPYTKGLLAAIPTADPDYEAQRERTLLTGDVPSPINPKPGCRFAARCGMSTEICTQKAPDLIDQGNGHFVACYNI